MSTRDCSNDSAKLMLLKLPHEAVTHAQGMSTAMIALCPRSTNISANSCGRTPVSGCSYASFLYFQLGTHKDLVAAGPSGDGDEPDEPEEAPSLSLAAALALLTAITVLVAFSSEFLTASIEEVSNTSGISRPFLGLIVLPIAG